jgi:hypothetical protein
MPRFRLDKWYFDCVTPEGDAWIGYSARVRIGVLRFRYGATIRKPSTAPVARQRQTLLAGRVDETADRLTWRNRSLGVVGTWTGGGASDETTILDGESGRIVWRCHRFRSRAVVSGKDGTWSGDGYAERLVVTVPPWRLPFDELRWGRFHAADRKRFVVWTDLRGALSGTWIWTEAGPARGSVTDDAVSVDGQGPLLLTPVSPIRTENVATTLLGRLRFLSRCLPERMRHVEEEKTLGTGRFASDDAESRGSAIYEVVRWA